ncbi:hypothetical protein BsWGS_08492 [Bradybaena similaris]
MVRVGNQSDRTQTNQWNGDKTGFRVWISKLEVDCDAKAGLTIAMTTGVHEILAGAKEFMHCCKILLQERRLVSSLVEDTGALMEQSQCQQQQIHDLNFNNLGHANILDFVFHIKFFMFKVQKKDYHHSTLDISISAQISSAVTLAASND